ncbi:MAG: type II toxin-antitoxin system VapC family toxin [Thermoanaerobaculia bacterium]
MICIDTMVLIWGVQKKARSGQEEMVERTARYLRSLQDENETIMVPAPAAAEYLQWFDDNERQEQLAALERFFFVPSFDLPAAMVAAELSHRSEAWGFDERVDRQKVKTDVQIIAIAIAHRAELIVTDNVKEFRAIASGRIAVKEVPSVAEQRGLF